ncbi:MAG: hypothetical protein LBT00_01600 [Spirochaetaceae bacterium]|nr:hypothetical protein [Spirochaetaceae bacterium]
MEVFFVWIASPTATMLPRVRNDRPVHYRLSLRGRSPKQSSGDPRLDCFAHGNYVAAGSQ